MPKTHPLKGPNRFKLGVFSTNADGGLAITTVPERWRARWDDNLNAVGIADRAGLEFVLPIARWRGFGGKTHVREWSFETFTWAAGLASATQQIGLFMTVHVPLVHPVYAAKALATVDHISHGRAGLNIVCGWNPDEFAMFGVDSRQRRLRPGGRMGGGDRARLRLGGAVRLRRAVLPAQGRGQPPAERAGAPARDHERRLRRARARLRGAHLRLPVLDLLHHRGRPPPHRGHPRPGRAEAGREVGIYTVCHVVCRETQGRGGGLLHQVRRGGGRPRARWTTTWRRRRSSPAPTTGRPTTSTASASPAARGAIR